jgi:hypothetical protein
MNSSNVRFAVALALLSIAGASASAASPFADLLARVPADANVIMASDIPAILNSPFGVSHKLADKRQKDYRSGLIDIPPTAVRALIAQSFDYSTLRPSWRIGIIELREELTPAQVAKRQNGTVDTVGGLPVVVCPRGQLFVFYSPTLIGEVNGVQRQELARWLRTTTSGRGTLVSDYLKEAVESVGADAQMVLAFDLDEVFHNAGLQEKLKDAKSLVGTGVDIDKVVATLARLRGARIRIKVADDIQGEIRLDFPAPPEVLRGVGKGLLLEVLNRIGAEIDEVNNWTPSIDGNQFVLQGQLSLSSARLILSSVDHRSTRQAYIEQEGSGGQTGQLATDPKGKATVEYYRSLMALLEDIEPGKKANSADRRTYYYKLYADKIDALPILNVDPGELQVASAISVTLRNLSSLSGLAKQEYSNQLAQFQQGFANASVGYGYAGPYGYGGWNYAVATPSAVNIDNFGQVRAMMASSAMSERAYREQTWINIKVVLSNLRRQLVEKYQVEV